VRAPLPQFRDTLIDADPAQRMPQRQPTNAAALPEAFRDFRSEASAGAGSSEGTEEVFGLTKKPKNLAEIYRAPTDLCFMGTFDELRAAGREQRRWLLVNIQSLTEFASQQLNADTWRDETLRAVIGSGFLFWQQYHDSQDGAQYCRYYLQNVPVFPHIGIVDPVTGQLVKSWTGFKDAERLMDKLMDYADAPPKDYFAEAAEQAAAAQTAASLPAPSPAQGAGAMDEGDDELAAAIAASLEPNTAAQPAAEIAPAPPPEVPWPAAPDLPAAGAADTVTLRVRLPTGQQYMQSFFLEHSLRDVFCAIHHLSGVQLSTAKAYQLATQGSPPFTDPDATLRACGLAGRVAVNLSEREA